MTAQTPADLRMPAEIGQYTIAKSFEVTARSITAFAGGIGDSNSVYFEDDRPGGLIAHPGMVFTWQWNSRFTPDAPLDLELVRRGVHACVDVQFHRYPREGDIITSQGQTVAVRQLRPGVLSTQRYMFRDSRGETVAIMDSGGITRGAALDGDDAEIATVPPLPQRSTDSGDRPIWSTTFLIDPQTPHVSRSAPTSGTRFTPSAASLSPLACLISSCTAPPTSRSRCER